MGLGRGIRRGAGPLRLPWGWAPYIVVLSPGVCRGAGPLRSPWGWAPEVAVGPGPCNRRGAGAGIRRWAGPWKSSWGWCICRCVGVDGPCVSSYPHGVSLSLKQPRHDRRDLGAFAAVWERMGFVSPRTPMGIPYPPSGPGRTGGFGCIRRCVGVDGPCVSSYPHGAALSPKRPKQDQRDSGVCAAVWNGWVGVSSYPHVASLSPKRPRQDRRDSGVSAAVSRWMGYMSPRTPAGRRYPPSGLGTTGGTRVSPPLCGSGWALCLLVPPRGIPIPEMAQVGPVGLGCIRPCVGVDGLRVSSYPHGASLSPKQPRQDRRDSGVSAALWGWLGPVHTLFLHRASLSLIGPRRTGGNRLFPPQCGGTKRATR